MTDNLKYDQCCPEFQPELWQDKITEWNNKKFIRDTVCTFMYMPMNFGKVMRRMDAKVREEKAEVPDWLCLSEHTSKWKMNLYLAVDKNIPDTENISLTGKFFSRVYEGPFKDTGKWIKDFEAAAKEKGHTIKKWYMWYTTCPKCAKKYGKNYVVVIGKTE